MLSMKAARMTAATTKYCAVPAEIESNTSHQSLLSKVCSLSAIYATAISLFVIVKPNPKVQQKLNRAAQIK